MPMQKLNVRFSDNTKCKISDAAEELDLFDSHVARAAMNIGLNAILKEKSQGCCSRVMFDWIAKNQDCEAKEKPQGDAKNQLDMLKG